MPCHFFVRFQSIFNRVFLKYFLFFLFSLCLLGCAPRSQQTSMEVPVVENALTLELTIGKGEVPEDYLLADPTGLVVSDNGDIIVTDENYLKVFNPRGKPKLLLGGKGQGPGEYEGARLPTISPTGNLAVIDVLWEYNSYGPELDFIEKYNLRADPAIRNFCKNENMTFNMFQSVYFMDTGHRLIGLFGQIMSVEGKYPVFYYVLDFRNGKLRQLVKCHSTAYVKNENGGGSSGNELLGGFHWKFLNDREIIYSATWEDREKSGTTWEYVLHVLELDTQKERELRIPYEPQEMPRYLKELRPFYVKVLNRTVQHNPDLKVLMSRQEYFPPFEALRTDGEFVYIFKYNPANARLDKMIEISQRAGEEVDEDIFAQYEPYETDVIRASSGRIVSKAKFPFIPEVIKKGKAYGIDTMDGLPKIYCGRIRPSVFGGKNKAP